MEGSVRWGMLSTARINRRVAPGIRASSITELAGVASRELSRAERAVKKLGAKRVFGSYEEMPVSDEVDAVYIPLPNSLHCHERRYGCSTIFTEALPGRLRIFPPSNTHSQFFNFPTYSSVRESLK